MRPQNELWISAELIQDFLADANVTPRVLVAPGLPKGAVIVGAAYDASTHTVKLEFDQTVPDPIFHAGAV